MKSNIKASLFFLVFCFSFTNVYSQQWLNLPTSGAISARSNASAVYDNVSNRMLVFGGSTSGGNVNDLWSLNLNTNVWSVIPPAPGQMPASRSTHVCMMDSLSNRMLMWSGIGNVLYNDVWAFNLNDSTWEELFPDGNVSGAPFKRYGVASVFDPLNRKLISFAGFTTSGRFDDTWAFNVDNQSWTNQSNVTFPLKRCLTSQSFASDRREMIVYGGQSTGNLKDIWTLNVDTYNWTNLTPAQTPVARHFSSNVYCGKGHVVIFGGDSLNQGNTMGALNDLWTFSLDSKTWNTLPQGSLRPSPRYGHTSVYIPSQDKMIIFGGQGSSSLNAETWVYSGISTLLNNANEISNDFTSLKCLPNPSIGNTEINFSLTKKSFTSLNLFDCTGKIVSTLIDTELPSGNHTINFSGDNLSPGIYLFSLKTDNLVESIRFMVIDQGK